MENKTDISPIIGDEINKIKGEARANEIKNEGFKQSFGEILKNGLAEEIKETLSQVPEIQEPVKESKIKKFFNRLMNTCQ